MEAKGGVRRGEGEEERKGGGEGAIMRTDPSMVVQLVLHSKWSIFILGE